jgi:hypothetical protein
MGKKSPPPKAPDLSGITQAQLQIAKDSNALAQEYLGLSREQYAFMQENAREELDLARTQADRLFEYQEKAFASDQDAKAFAQKVGQSQIDAMNLQMDYAKKDRERYENVFLPMQDKYIAEANAYDTPERREQEAGRASVDIQRQAEAARSNSDQRLRSMGLDPSQMRSATLLDTQSVALAAQQAGAANAARQGVEDRGRAMRADALNVGAGLPAQSLAGFAGAGNSGAGALGAGQAGQQAQLGAISGGAGVASTAMGFRSSALNNLANLTGSPTQWAGMGGNMLGQASSAYGNTANTMSQGFQNEMSSWKAGQEQAQQGFNNIMSVASLAGGMMMAEGGEVRRDRAVHRAEGGVIQREQFPLASAVIEGDFTRIENPKQMAISAPAGPSMTQRFDSGMSMMGRTDPGNVWAEGDQAPPPMMVNQQRLGGDNMAYAAEGGYAGVRNLISQVRGRPQMMAEGGQPQRARGALPVRQSRDVLPAYLAEGEYVIPADVVRSVGLEKLDKMVAKYHRENA